MKLGLCALFIGAAIMPACAQGKIHKLKIPKVTPKNGGNAAFAVKVPKTPVVLPTASHASVAAAASVGVTPKFLSAANTTLNTTVERRLMQGISAHSVDASVYGVKPAPLNLQVLPDIGTPYLNITIQQVRDFLMSHGRFDRGTSSLERITSTFERTDKIFFTKKRDGYHLNESVAKNVTYDEVWYLLVQDTGFDKRGMSPFVDIDFSKSEIDGVNIHDWIVAKHQELRAKSNWYDRFAVWSDTSVGTKSNPVLPVLKFRQLQITSALRPSNSVAKPQMGDVSPKTDITTRRTAEEIQFLLDNLPADNPLRQQMEYILWENGYLPE